MSCKYCNLKLDKEELEYGYELYRGEEVQEGYIYAYGEDNDKFGYSQHTCGIDAGISDIKYCPFCGDRLGKGRRMSSPTIERLKGQHDVLKQISKQLKETQEFESRITLKKGSGK